jgi:hypothetical protein
MTGRAGDSSGVGATAGGVAGRRRRRGQGGGRS